MNCRSLLGAGLGLVLLLVGCSSNPMPAEPTVGPTLIRYGSIVHPVYANAGMVVSQNDLATQVGQSILAEGGNAIDAAVAVGFALAVTLPRAGNLGGSGFMLVHTAQGDTIALDFRSAAPANFDPANHLDADGNVDTSQLKFGAQANGVPGTVAGLFEAWKRFGSRPWAELLQPAIQLAQQGITVSYDLALALKSETAVFRQFPSSRAVYFSSSTGATPEPGALWQQPALAGTLKQLGEGGADAFYRGVIAERLVTAIQRDGGYLTLADLANYQVRERQPLQVTYRGKTVVSMPPVSGGGLTLLQMLNVLQEFDVSANPQGSAASLHLLAEVMKQGAANRRYGIGDPDFVEVPKSEILSRPVAKRFARSIRTDRAAPVGQIKPLHAPEPKSRDTTHYSVLDRWGNAVATTYTLGYSFGSGYVAGDTGVLLDNQLRNFTYAVQPNGEPHANGWAPGKRMMSTMTPTIVLNEQGAAELVTGSPGGGRIINVVLQILVNVLDYDMNLAQATHVPRVHQPWRSPELSVEPGIPIDTIRLLEQRGHQVLTQPSMGSTQSILYRDGLFQGAADPRRPGASARGLQVAP